MAGFRPKVNWFSPRAVKEPTSRVVEERIGTNSFRFKVKRNVESNRLETPMMDQGLRYEDYKKQKKKSERRKNSPYWGYDDDFHGNNNTEQVVHYNRNPYEWTPTRWSNWNYTSFLNTNSDDNVDMFVKEPDNYLTPTSDQIKAKTNYWTYDDIKRIKELSRVCYLKMIDDKKYISEQYEDIENINISPEEWRKKKEMFDNVYTTYVPGFTPLEQAIAINHKIRDTESKLRANKHKEQFGRSSTFYEFRRSDYADPTINYQLDLCKIDNDFRLDVLNNISVMGDLGSQFKVERDVGEKQVGYSDNQKPELMTSYDQITNISMYQRMLHGYNIKFLTKNLVVNVPVETSEKKQKIVILLDFSGSMKRTYKQTWVNAILADRFRYVMKGEAEVYISYFVSNPSDLWFRHIKNEQDVTEFWKQHDNYPNGSYTNIGRIVEYTAKCIKSGSLHNLKDVDLSKELPEILIINDGEDEVGYKSFPYKVNAISLMMHSVELQNLCVASGGKQVFIKEDKSIYAYSSQGMEIISK